MAQKLSYAERVRNAHIPSSSSSLTMTDVESSSPKHLAPKPVLNVWNVRMEKMAAIRAAQKNPAQDTSSSKSSPAADRDDDPFVVRMPVQASPIASGPPQASDKPKNSGLQVNWPQVGDAISVSASPSDSSITSDGTKSVNVNGSSPRKSAFPSPSLDLPPKLVKKIAEKAKWVNIPKQEAAVAASTSTSKRHPRSHRQQSSSTTTNTDPSNNTSADAGASTSSSNPLSQSQTHSAHTSTSHSRAESLQSSPKLARNGKKLPPESDNQRSISGSDGGDANSGDKILPANSDSSPKQDDAHPHEGNNDNLRLNKGSSTRKRASSQSQSQSHPPSLQGYSVASSKSVTNQPQPFLATPPVFFQPSQQNDRTSSANSNASISSSPRIQHSHPLSSPPSSSASAQSLHPPLQNSSFPHPHHGQSTYPHAPYPLYNLSAPPMNSYNYVPTDIAPHSSHYPPPPNLRTPPSYGQVIPGPLPNGIGPTDRNRDSPAAVSTTKSNDPPAAREKMIFGSIDVLDVKVATVEEETKEEEKDKKKPFAIGIENGHDLPGRSRPIQKKTGGRTMGGRQPSVKDKNDKKVEKDRKKPKEDKEDESTVSATAMAPKDSIVEPRWTFGTTRQPPSPRLSTSSGASSPSQPAAKVDTSAEDDTTKASIVQPISAATTPLILEPQDSSSFFTTPSNIPLPSSMIHPSPHHHPYHLHLHRMPSPSALSLPPPLSIPIQVPVPVPTASSTSDPDLEVKDYGYGFGDASGLGYAPIIAKERAREWEAERARERAAAEVDDTIPALGLDNDDVITSPMTESGIREGTDKDNILIDQSLPREYIPPREYLARGRRGFPNPRGGYGDRGSGSYRRQRGVMNGFPRGLGRGGGHYGSHHNRGGPGLSPVMSRGGPPSPFNVTPPHHFQPLPLDSSAPPPSLPPPPLGGFYHPHPHHPNPGRPYIPPGYEAFNPSPTIAGVPPPLPVDPNGILLGQPQHHLPQSTQGLMLASGKHLTAPVPVPMTTIPFPLDSTRYYLLGQLEYYLSPENMAQDFYLRQQVFSLRPLS